jgi:hypothetical protein
MGEGSKPDLERRRQMSKTRAQGWTLASIVEALGICRQAVLHGLQYGSSPCLLAMASCPYGTVIVSAGLPPRDASTTPCLAGVVRDPAAMFGQRHKAFRRAAGLAHRALERAARTASGSAPDYDRNGFRTSKGAT